MKGTKSVVMVLLTAVTVISPAASAQYPGGHGGGTRGGMGSGHAAQEPSKTRDQPAADTPSNSGAPVLVQLDQLEDDLKLTPQQRAVWNDYADKVLRLADDMTRTRFAARALASATGTTAVQQLDQLAGSARTRLTAVEDIVEAGKTLYAILTPAQKAIADRKLVLAMPPLATGISAPGWAMWDTVGGRQALPKNKGLASLQALEVLVVGTRFAHCSERWIALV